MKNLILISIVMTTLLIASCKKSGCTDPDAINYSDKAKKDDGTCEYPSDKFVGTYSVSEACTGLGNDTYTITISATGNTTVQINSWLGGSAIVTGIVNGNTLTINPQSAIPDKGNYYWDMDIAPIGTLSGNTLTIPIQIDDILYSNIYGYVNCTLTCTK